MSYGVWKPTKQLLHSCTLPQDAAASYRAGGLEVDVAGFLTAARDGADLRRREGYMGRTYFGVMHCRLSHYITIW
jgi:hypothetical protein